MTEDAAPEASLGYVLAQLFKAYNSGSEHAPIKQDQWRRVLIGMLDGQIAVGSDTPLGLPKWVSLEVIHGGFATGGLKAGGPLLPWERARAEALGYKASEPEEPVHFASDDAIETERLASLEATGDASTRRFLNRYAQSSAGEAELQAALQNRSYCITQPEEGALLVWAWLRRHGRDADADALLSPLKPFESVIRFYPELTDAPQEITDAVRLLAPSEVQSRMLRRAPKPQIRQMELTETLYRPIQLAIWAWFEAVSRAHGRLGELPERFSEAEQREAAPLYQRLQAAKRRHPLGRKQRETGSFHWLDVALSEVITEGCISPRSRHRLRVLLKQAPKQPAERPVSAYRHAEIRNRLAHRLTTPGPDLLAPLSLAETDKACLEPGVEIPDYLQNKLAKACLATPEAHLEAGRIQSAEQLARLMKPWAAVKVAESVADPELRLLLYQLDLAFRARRSLLLFELQSQIRFEELPWVKPLAAESQLGSLPLRAFHDLMPKVLRRFPGTPFPNVWLTTLRSLFRLAGLRLPLVDELAADIFMGRFAPNYLRAAQLAAERLEGRLYARYYRLDTAAIRAIPIPEASDSSSAPHAEAFDAMAIALAGLTRLSPGEVTENGAVIEQGQILSTANLASLFAIPGLSELLQPELLDLAKTSLRQAAHFMREPRLRLRHRKNAAYAWRAMVFYLSEMPPSELARAFTALEVVLQRVPKRAEQRLRPEFAALWAAARGDATETKPFLGWVLRPRAPESA